MFKQELCATSSAGSPSPSSADAVAEAHENFSASRALGLRKKGGQNSLIKFY